MDREEKRLLARLKEWAIRMGYRISKSRQLDMDNQGQYRLTDTNDNTVVLGERYDASLAAIEQYLTEEI